MHATKYHWTDSLNLREYIVTRGPRTLKYYGNPQILDGRLEVQVGKVRTLWGAPVDVGRHRNP